ncbi:hypothetical protein SacmaDRAFT_4379 [Saccharomonospora marina XMU15]|uniref:Gram-positive cocci surface proteins LPxTG domain-containing protein n=1 Tax=Saccharomonospora marina XMU15 TaxID=882083 RepID=H5X8Z0_9PSEU|nr:hypothetical protein [Saccharomonospora marina]EHR52565.1 hypothetical protein SacmaDRAFT_4379 [Saccharomonospora marina XMU15]
MSVSPRSLLRVVAASAMTLGLLAGTTGLASATNEPSPSDSRATVHGGNVDAGQEQKDPCGTAGLDGEPLPLDEDDPEQVRGGDGTQYLDILDIPEAMTVTGVVVKGGNGYNVYSVADLGQLPWEDLQAPLTGQNDNLPDISHWFVCGEKDGEDSTTTTKPSETGTTTETSEPTTSGTEPTSTRPTETTESATTSGGAAAATTTTQPAVSPAGDSGDLASTGFSGGWLLGVGGALLVGGGALLALARARRGKA